MRTTKIKRKKKTEIKNWPPTKPKYPKMFVVVAMWNENLWSLSHNIALHFPRPIIWQRRLDHPTIKLFIEMKEEFDNKCTIIAFKVFNSEAKWAHPFTLDALSLAYLWCGPTNYLIQKHQPQGLKATWLVVIIPKMNLKELKRKFIVARTNPKTKDPRPCKDYDGRKW